MDDPITDERLAEMRKRADGATAGPWTTDRLYVEAPDHVHIADLEWLADSDEEWAEFERNAAFVAAAREDVPALLTEVDRRGAVIRAQHAELERLRVEVKRWEGLEALAKTLVQQAGAERDEARSELEQLRAMYDDLCETTSRTGTSLATAERERDEARADTERLRGGLIDAEATRDKAFAAHEAMLRRLKLAEDVCVMFGWSPSVSHLSDRAKATSVLWRRWFGHVDEGFLDPANHPDLDDAAIAALAHERDETRERVTTRHQHAGVPGMEDSHG